jgi:hypothetical protein
MRASEAVSRIPATALQAFMSRLSPSIRDSVVLLENPTDELVGELAHAKSLGKGWGEVPLFARSFRARMGVPAPRPRPAPAADKDARLEENYFYSTRRFPQITTNTLGGGTLAAGNFPYFSKGISDDGVSLGFPSGFPLDTTETNMASGSSGLIPVGTGFVFTQLGVSFNSGISTADLAVLLDAATLRFSKGGGQFTMDHGPLKMWPSGMGISGFAATAVGGTPLTIQAANNGAPDPRAVRSLKLPRVLKSTETFSYSVVLPRATKALDGTALTLSAFVLVTLWLFGAQRNLVAS